MTKYDAVVVGSGPNGLAAAVTLARAGCSVLVVEAKETVGGGMRSLELTRPGFIHDVCSAVHPLGMGSPFFKELPLADYGLEWIQPDLPLAHPFDDGTAAVLDTSIEATGASLGEDGLAYERLITPFVKNWPKLAREFLGPLRLPRHPLAMTGFGLRAVLPASVLAKLAFRGERARALFAGLSAHSVLPLEHVPSSAIGLILGVLAHVVGWPIPQGGSQSIADALVAYLKGLGGEVQTGVTIGSLADLPSARAYLLAVGPHQLEEMVGDGFPAGFRRQLKRYRYGPGVFKVDWALSEPIPWRAEACGRAGTVHVGGTLAEISLSERAMWRGEHAERPYVLVAQQSLFDGSRAPAGAHTGWAYCHVPAGSGRDMTDIIENQMERFAPGFRDTILDRHTMTTRDYSAYNPNYIGGDINGGIADLFQLFTRPTVRFNPYTTPLRDVYLCSASTPPGGGVHGMCGYFAAQTALRRL